MEVTIVLLILCFASFCGGIGMLDLSFNSCNYSYI